MISELPLNITSEALEQIKMIMAKKSVPQSYGLRVGTNSAATCGTISFMLGFDEKKSGDDSFQFEGIEVLINKKEMLHLIDITLDYEEGEEASGFRFDKPTT